jgi:hypothetical protein
MCGGGLEKRGVGEVISIFANMLILFQVLLEGVRKIFYWGDGVEDYEDGAALGGGEGGDGRVEVGMRWAGEGEWQVLVGSGVVGGVEEKADELAAIIRSGKKREKRGTDEL